MSEGAWARLRADARDDPAVLGLVLTGGRGKGVWTDRSDWDGVVVVADAGVDRWRTRAPDDLDLTILGGSEFETYAEPFTPFAWRGYDFARLSAALDRGGFQAALDRKGRLRPNAARRIAEEAIGGALNQLYRATKNDRDGNPVGARLDIVESIASFLEALFALEGRHRPYNKLLAWELEQEPLVGVRSDDLLHDIEAIATLADLAAAWRLQAALEASCVRAGATTELNDWEDHLSTVRPV